jgi:hypothetical protein
MATQAVPSKRGPTKYLHGSVVCDIKWHVDKSKNSSGSDVYAVLTNCTIAGTNRKVQMNTVMPIAIDHSSR